MGAGRYGTGDAFSADRSADSPALRNAYAKIATNATAMAAIMIATTTVKSSSLSISCC